MTRKLIHIYQFEAELLEGDIKQFAEVKFY